MQAIECRAKSEKLSFETAEAAELLSHLPPASWDPSYRRLPDRQVRFHLVYSTPRCPYVVATAILC